MTRLAPIVCLVLLASACSDEPGANAATNNAAATNNGSNAATNNGSNAATNNGSNAATTNNGSNAATNNTNAPMDPVVVLINPDDCYALSDDPDTPLALDGVFDAGSPVWRRPHSEEAVCPAPELLPDTAALVPYLAVKFCNTDSVEHAYNVELLGQDGPGGEAPLDDAYLVLYEGEELPTDHRQCLAANDDIEGAIDSGDAELLSVTVPAGGAVTIVATTFTFDPTDGTGTGGYILIVTNAD